VTKKWANPTKVRKLCSHPQKAFEKIFALFSPFFKKQLTQRVFYGKINVSISPSGKGVTV
jgi:hypothetical protein